MTYSEYKAALKEIGISYLSGVKKSAKMNYSFNNGWVTSSIYLAPANLSSYEVCPNSEHCREFCLNGAGHNKSDIIARGAEHSHINQSRIKKTKLFFENRELFMRILCYEIKAAKRYAEKLGMGFCVRLNCTSDLSPLAFRLNGVNILELFPDIQFYDYTKVPNRMALPKKYANYDLTFSFDGWNWETCEEYLKQGGRVAVVFENGLPTTYKGYKVTDANGSDTRFLEGGGEISGLHYHRVGANYKNGKYQRPDTPFIIKEEDENCTWEFPLSE